MDPLSAASLCFQASKAIYENVKHYLEVDDDIDRLDKDYAALKNNVAVLHASLKVDAVTVARAPAQWRNLEWSVDDLALAMESLSAILREIKGDGTGPMSGVVRTAKLQNKAAELDAIHKRIEARTQSIQLAFHFLNLYSP
jgi:hypothetical protein